MRAPVATAVPSGDRPLPPQEDRSLIEIDSSAQYWLSVGAQPTEPVLKLLKITGDRQKFKGLPGTEGTLKVKGAQTQQARAVQRGPGPGADRASGGETVQLKKKKAPKRPTTRLTTRLRLPLKQSPPPRSAEPAAE